MINTDLLLEFFGHGKRKKEKIHFPVQRVCYDSPIGTILMAAYVGGDLRNDYKRSFVLNGILPKDDTFVEPTATQSDGTGTTVLSPSVQGTFDPVKGYTPFTTAGVFTPAPGYTGDTTLSFDVMGVDDQDFTFTIVAPPGPEVVTLDTTSIVDAPQ